MNRLMMDVGQTGTQWRAIEAGVPGDVTTGPGLDGSRDILDQVARLLDGALSGTRGDWSAFIGVSGLDAVTRAADVLMERLRDRRLRRVVVAHDSVTSALGAIGTSTGVVLAIGTGIVTMGVGPTKAVRVDGWGSLLDDAGSAFWIGQAGIRAALRAADGRGAPTSLLERAANEFGSVMSIAGSLQRSPTRVRDIAGFARAVTESAGTRDEVADAICDAAVREWLISARAAADRSGLLEPPPGTIRLSWSGNVLTRSELLRERLRAALPSPLELHPPLGSPLDGAEWLADVAPGSPLRPLIDDSLRHAEHT